MNIPPELPPALARHNLYFNGFKERDESSVYLSLLRLREDTGDLSPDNISHMVSMVIRDENELLYLANYLEAKEPEELDMNLLKSKLFDYLEGFMFKDKPQTLTILGVEEEKVDVGSGRKEDAYLMSFKETKKKAFLNKTNAKVLIQAYGPETEGWRGKKAKLYAIMGKAFGEESWWLRMAPAGAQIPAAGMGDDIPEVDINADLEEAYKELESGE